MEHEFKPRSPAQPWEAYQPCLILPDGTVQRVGALVLWSPACDKGWAVERSTGPLTPWLTMSPN